MRMKVSVVSAKVQMYVLSTKKCRKVCTRGTHRFQKHILFDLSVTQSLATDQEIRHKAEKFLILMIGGQLRMLLSQNRRHAKCSIRVVEPPTLGMMIRFDIHPGNLMTIKTPRGRTVQGRVGLHLNTFTHTYTERKRASQTHFFFLLGKRHS